MNTDYDAIVVGTRCAGASTSLLLTRSGCRVPVVDWATLPCETVSTHILHPRGVAAARRHRVPGRRQLAVEVSKRDRLSAGVNLVLKRA